MRLTPERLEQIRALLNTGRVRTSYVFIGRDLLDELDAMTRERDEAQKRLDMSRTLVEQVADDCKRRSDHNGQVLALAIREILHDDALNAAIEAEASP